MRQVSSPTLASTISITHLPRHLHIRPQSLRSLNRRFQPGTGRLSHSTDTEVLGQGGGGVLVGKGFGLLLD